MSAGDEAPGRRPAALPPEVEDLIKRLAGADVSPEAGATALAAIAHRAANELHRLARAEAAARRDRPEWGAWASVANAARDAVLKLAAVRRTVGETAPPHSGE